MKSNQAMQEKEEPASLWRNKNFLLLWGGTTIQSIGMQMYILAIPLLIYSMTESALAMSTMRAIDFFPNIFLGIIAGVLVDRVNRKTMMRWTSLISVTASLGMILLLLSNTMQVWHLYILGFILSSAGYTFGNANHSVMPQIVSKEQLTSANARLSFVGTFIQTVGPGLAGMLLSMMTTASVLSIYTASLVLLFICVQFVEIPGNKLQKPEHARSWKLEIKEGWEELFRNKTLLTPTITIIFINLAMSLVIGVLVFYAADQLQASEREIGLMFSISSLGGLLGALAVKPLRKKINRGRIFTSFRLVDVIAMVLLIIANTWWVLGISLAIRTFSTVISNIIYLAIRQEVTPNHMLGRVAGTSSMFMKLTLPLGLFIAGIWAEWLPIPLLFIFSAAIFLTLFIWLSRHPFRKVE
ncbi:MFS transporter [Oceanobacillus neutriphilus]|uniref:MFS transporter n=1 Tax=Oceanobacillus neutriphilus TaxID=531815 RepID=A0ABQ2NXV6_9BACI|nr:MFS transporter [Oceanobacillus neutriphilus]GGP13263.1 MFS transporter [Oceanobacillus neutriphilus]